MRAGTLLPKNRLEAFSDGVLAIVITILVLELEIPDASVGSGLAEALAEEWKTYLGYLISFAFVGGCWVAHSNATRLIDRADPLLFRLTLIWLLFVSLIPFTTALMTGFLGEPGEETAVVVYGIDLLLASLLLTMVIRYAARRPEMVAGEIADEELEENVRQRSWLLGFQAIAVVLAVVAPNVAVGLYLLISVLFIVAPLLAAGRSARSGAGG